MIKLLLLQTISSLQAIKIPAQTLMQQFNLKYIEYIEIKLNELNSETVTANEIASFFSNLWPLIQNTFLSYTASHQTILSGVLFELVVVVAQELGQNPLNILMPGLNFESMSDEFPDLIPDYSVASLRDCLKKHILSDNSKYLIPIEVVCTQELSPNSHQKFLNPYYNFQIMDEACVYLTELELQRIEKHSPDLTALVALRNQYIHLISDQKSLLSELFRLLESLYINGAHGGSGKQDNAGQEVYTAIIHFNHYYQLLTSEAKLLIPDDVKKEIELLLSLSSDPLANSDATSNLETCIASRRDKLAVAVKAHQQLIANIDLQDQAKVVLIEDAYVKYQVLQQRILSDLRQNKYINGQEHLGLSAQLISVLNIELQLDSKELFNDFLELPAHDIALFCDVMDLSISILTHFFTLDDFIFYVITAEASRLKVILSKFSKLFTDSYFIGTPYFSYFLSIMSDKHLEIILHGFRNYLLDIIHDGYYLSHIMQFLTPLQQEQVLSSLLPILPFILTRGLEVQYLLGVISPKSFKMIYPQIKPLLQQLIIDVEFFNKLTASLDEDQIRECFWMHHYYLRYTLRSVADVELMIQYLDANTREQLFDQLVDIWPQIVKDAGDFFKLLNLFSINHRNQLFDIFESRLIDLLVTGEDFIACLIHYSMPYRGRLCMLFADKLPLLLEDYLYFGHVLRLLDSDLQYSLLVNLKHHLPMLANTPRKVATILSILDMELKNWFFNHMFKLLIWQINYSDDLISIIKHLSDKDTERLLIKLDGKYQKMMPLASQLRDIIEHLSLKNTKLLIIILGEDIKKLVSSGYHFSKLVKGLHNQKIIEVFNMLIYFLPDMITSVPDFFKLIECLPQKQKTHALTMCLFRLLELTHDVHDFINLLAIIELDELKLFISHLGPKTNILFTHIYDLHYMMSKVTETQRGFLFDCFHEKILQKVTKFSDFILLSEVLDANQMQRIFENSLDVLSASIQSKNQLARLLKVLDDVQIKQLLISLESRLKTIIHKPTEFKLLGMYISDEVRDHLFSNLRDHLLSNSYNFFQLTQFLSLLTPQLRVELFPQIVQKMDSCIHSPLDSQLFFEILSPLEIEKGLQMMPIKQKIASTITEQAQFTILQNYYEKKLAHHPKKSFAQFFLQGILLNIRELIIDEQALGQLKPTIIKLYHQCHYAMTRVDKKTAKALLLDCVHESLSFTKKNVLVHRLLGQLLLAIELVYPTSLLEMGFFASSSDSCQKIQVPVLK